MWKKIGLGVLALYVVWSVITYGRGANSETAVSAQPQPKATATAKPAPTATKVPEPTATPIPVFKAGDTVRLRTSDGKLIPVAVNEAAREAVNKAQAAGDNVGLQELVITGRMFAVTSGTPALVLDRDGIFEVVYQVRVQDGPHAGKAGWVARDWIVAP